MKIMAMDGSEIDLEHVTQEQVGSSPLQPVKEFGKRLASALVPDPSTAPELENKYGLAANLDPDQVARDREAKNMLGLSEDIDLDDNRQAAYSVAAAKRNSPEDWNEFVGKYPATARYLQNNMAVSHDDIGNLSALEEAWNGIKEVGGSFGRGLAIGQLNNEQAKIWSDLMKKGRHGMRDADPAVLLRDQQIEARLKELTSEGSAAGANGWSVNAIAQSTGQFIPSMKAAMEKGYFRGLQYAATFAAGAAILGNLGPQALTPEEIVTVPAAALIGFGAGMKAGVFEGSMEMESSIYKDLLEIKDDKGNKIAPETAWAIASLAAAAKGGLEIASLPKILKVIPGGNAILKTMEARGGQAFLDQIKVAGSNKAVVKRILLDFGIGVVAENATEVAQTGTDILAKNVGITMSNVDPSLKTPLGGLEDLYRGFLYGQDPSDSNPSAMMQFGETVRATTQGVAGMGLPGTALNLHSGLANAKQIRAQIETDVARFSKIEEAYKATKTATRSESAATEFLGENLDGTGLETVYVDANAFSLLFQSKAPEVAKALGVSTEQLEEATTLGGKLAVPTKSFVPNIVKSGLYQSIVRDITFDKNGRTYNEAKADLASTETEMVREMEKAQAEIDAAIKEKSEVAAVFNTVFNAEKARFIEAGHSEKEAAANAMQIAKGVVVETARRGGDFNTYWQRLSYDIQLHEKDSSGNWVPTRMVQSPAKTKEATAETKPSLINTLKQSLFGKKPGTVQPAGNVANSFMDGNTGTASPITSEENIRRGTEAMQRVIATHEDVLNAMYRPEVGSIEFIWGEEGTPDHNYENGFGVAKVIKKHGQSIAENIPEVIAKGKAELGKFGDRVYFSLGDMLAIVRLTWDGNERVWLLTGFLASENEKPPVIPEDVGPSGTTSDERSFVSVAEASIDSIAQKIAKKKMLQSEHNSDPRAAVNLSTRIISYFNTDRSGFSHEFAHIRLDELLEEAAKADGNEAVKADVARIKAWFGQNIEQVRESMREEIKALESQDRTPDQEERLGLLKAAIADDAAAQTMIYSMNPGSAIEGEYYTRFHELWARGWETYLMEGKAPTPELRGVFRRFMKWLTGLYKSAVALNAPISDEVREVMDRLLATEQEIKAVHAEQEIAAQVVDQMNLEPGTVEDLVGKSIKARERAEDILRRAKMKQISAEQKAAEAAERERVRPEIIASVDKMPFWDAAGDIKKVFNGKLQAVADKYLAGTLTEEESAVFDTIAESYGYSSGDELARVVLRHPTFEQEVERRTKEHIDAYRAAQPVLDPIEAIHNDDSLELIALQKEILADVLKSEMEARTYENIGEGDDVIHKQNESEAEREAGEYGKQAVADARKMPGRIRAENRASRIELARRAEQSARVLRLQAQMLIESKPMQQVVPETYHTQEVRAAKEFERAMLREDFPAAIEAKNRQLLNHSLFIAATWAKRQSAKNEKSMRWFRSRPREKSQSGKSGWKHEKHYDQSGAILARFGFQRSDYDPAKPVPPLAQWEKEMADICEVSDIAPWIVEGGANTKWSELTIRQQEDVVNALKNIWRIAGREDRTIRALGGMEMASIYTMLKEARDKNTSRRSDNTMSRHVSGLQKAMQTANRYRLDIIDQETLLRELDGFQDFGPWWQTFYEMFDQAASEELRLTKEYTGRIKDIFARYTNSELERMRTKHRYIQELDQSLTQYDLIALALNWGNAGNRQRLLAGFRETWGAALTEDEFQTVLNRELSEKDWQTAQKIWDTLEDLKPFLFERHKEITGFEPKSVEADPVVTPWGTLRGGYYPLRRDPRQDTRARVSEESEDPLYKGQSAVSQLTKMGSMKQRSEAAVYPVDPDITIVLRHLQEVIHDATHRGAVIDAHKMLRDPDISGLIKETLGMDGLMLFKKWVNSIAGEAPVAEGADKFVNGLRKRVSGSLMMWNIGMMTQNVSNFVSAFHAVEGFDTMNVARAIVGAFSGDLLKKQRELVYSKSAFMESRSRTVDRDAADLSHRLLEGHSLLRIDETAATAFVVSDLMTSIPVWLEAYRVGLKKHGYDDAKAVQFADMAVRRSHGSGLMKDIAQIQKSHMGRFMTMFSSFALKQVALGYEEIIREGRQPIRNLPRFLGFVLSRWILMSVLGELFAFRGWPDDDEDEDKWLGKWARKIAYYPISMLPYFRDIVPIMEAISGAEQTYNPRLSSAAALYEDAGRTAKIINSELLGDKETDMGKVLEAIGSTASYAKPLPRQFQSWIWNGYDILENDMEPEFEDLIRRRPKRER